MQRTNYMESFGRDPFFSDISQEMNRMNTEFENMVGTFPMLRSVDPSLSHNAREQTAATRPSDSSRSISHEPFNLWTEDPFGAMSTMMRNMEQSISSAPRAGDANSNVHSYSSSSHFSCSSNDRDGPRVIEAHTAERRAPGGVSETRRAYSDSKTGATRMAIGHHVGDRAHIVERSENRVTGQREQRNEYRGLEEKDVEQFTDEWRQRSGEAWNRRHLGLGHESAASRCNGTNKPQQELQHRPLKA